MWVGAVKMASLLRFMGVMTGWPPVGCIVAESVENVISSLRSLTATKFATSGFATPDIQATVTSNGGSLVEKVSIAKSGSDYLAQRANEPTLYVLDPAAITGLESAAKGIHTAKPAK